MQKVHPCVTRTRRLIPHVQRKQIDHDKHTGDESSVEPESAADEMAAGCASGNV
jgi:hypothetical protein